MKAGTTDQTKPRKCICSDVLLAYTRTFMDKNEYTTELPPQGVYFKKKQYKE